MNALLILLISIVCLFLGYILYGRWLAKIWGLDDKNITPAHAFNDGNDYCPAKAPVLLGHHFSSIAGAGPINGPIQAAVFGWLPVLLWIIIGGIFFGAVHDFGSLFASIRNKGQSIGEVINKNIGKRAKKLFIIFAYLVLVLVVAAFASIVASTFNGFDAAGATVLANGRTASISMLFIVLAIIFGYMVYRRNTSLTVSTVLGVIGIILIVIIGMKFPIYLKNNTWIIILGIYILVASVAPVWILLQPRDYLSSFLLYFMMAVAFFGILFAHPVLDIPAFTGFSDSLTNLGGIFPALFVTIACGAISGFHSLVSSGTTSKQLNIAYGGMLLECVLATVALIAVGYCWANYSLTDGSAIRTPTVVFASGISQMITTIPFAANWGDILYSLLVLAVSVFCLTSLDTATRLARYMFQEFWLEDGETVKSVSGYRAVLCNPYVATLITVFLGVGLSLTGWDKIWPLFGAANQLLAALALLAVACWLGKMGKNNKMLFLPMLFMLIVTLTSLAITIKTKFGLIIAGSGTVDAYLQGFIAAFLFVLAFILAFEGLSALIKQKN